MATNEHNNYSWPLIDYLLYNSTINCSLIGIWTSSSRLGTLLIRPFRFSRSTSIQEGDGACAVASREERIVGLFLLDLRTEITSPGFTMNEGMLTFRPFTSMCPWRTIWRAWERLAPRPMREVTVARRRSRV